MFSALRKLTAPTPVHGLPNMILRHGTLRHPV